MIEKTRYIPDGKSELKKLEIKDYLKAKNLYFPLTNSRFQESETFIKLGDRVTVGEIIGKRKNAYAEQNIHSTVSGKYTGEEKLLDNSGKVVSHLVIENDFKDEFHPSVKERNDAEIAKLTQADFVEIMKDRSLVGLGGGAFPTYIKFDTSEHIEIVVGNGVECEPYLVSDYYAMELKTEEMLQGLLYSMQAVGAKRGVIAIKNKYKELCVTINNVINEKFPDRGLEVVKIGNYYPQGWELEVIKRALKIKVPQGELPAKYGVINVNTTTLISIYDAVKKNRPVINRYVVLSGNGINNKAFNARVGTNLKELVDDASLYINEEHPKVLIIGGPMMGTNVLKDEVVVSPTVTSFIVLNDEKSEEMSCLRCASCVYSCPADLQPVQIMNAYKMKDKDMIKALNVNKCIECGLCSYTCPSKIHLTEYMRLAKKIIR